MMTVAALANTCISPLLGLAPEQLDAPFGLRLGRTTIEELEGEFVITCDQGMGFTGGRIVQVVPRYEEHSDIACMILAFDKSNVLDAAWFTLAADQYENAFNQLQSRFEFKNTNDPIKGSKSSLFVFEFGQITLHAPLFSKEMTLGYRTEKFNAARMASASEAYE